MSNHKAKRVSNYELFFDLAVVLAIGQLTSAIHVEHIGLQQIIGFLAGIVIILNIWNNEAFYYNKFGDSRRADIYSVIILMLWIGNLALAFNFDVTFLRENYNNVLAFNSMLILSYATIALQYFLKGKKLGFLPDIKLNLSLIAIYILPLVPIATGLVQYNDWVLSLYFIPMLIPIIQRLPFFKSSIFGASSIQEINFPHALERNQLLTILTFGESVIGTIRTYPLMTHPIDGLLFFLGLGTLFIFYMTQTFININHHQRTKVFGLFYSHALIIISLLFFTVGLEFLADHHHHDLGVIFFIGAIMSFYVGVIATSIYNQDFYRLNRKVIAHYAVTLLIGAFLFYLFRNNSILLGLTLVVHNYTMMQISMKHRFAQRERNNIPHPDPTQNLRDFS